MKKRLMPCLTAGVVFSAVEQETTSLSTSSPVDKDLLELFKKAGEIDQLYYDFIVSDDGEELYKGKTWMKGSKVRNEMDFDGDIMVFIYDVEAGEGYSYNPAEKTGMLAKLDPELTEDLMRSLLPIRRRLLPVITG
ncbi:MAG: hypothetical protein ACOX3Y_00850 [Clostridia bacterium]